MRNRQYLRLGVVGVPALFLATALLMKPVVATYMWAFFGVSARFPRFVDTRVITSGWDCTRQGIDPLKTNPCDPWNGATFNYPRLWLLPGYLGLGASSSEYLAVAIVIAFLISVLLLLGPISRRQALYYLLFIFSFPVMLLIERGNNDLVIFTLLVGIAAILSWHNRLGPTNAAALILLAATLKLYPIAAVHALFLRLRGWRQQLLAASVLVLAAGYALVTWRDLALIESSTPRPTFAGYGLNIVIRLVFRDLNRLFRIQTPVGVEVGTRGVVLLALAVLAIALARRLPRERIDWNTQRGRFVGLLFSLGASVYVLTFVIGNNYDYRLTFLLLVLPQLFVWTESPSSLKEARVVLATVLGSLWLSVVTVSPIFQIDQLAFYALFVYFVAVLVIATVDQPDVAMMLRRRQRVAHVGSVSGGMTPPST